MRTHRRGIITLSIALCAQLLAVLLQHGLPMLLLARSVRPEIVFQAISGLQLLVGLGVLGALVVLAHGTDTVALIAKLGAGITLALLGTSVLQLALHAQPPPWAFDLRVIVSCATPIACWLALVALSHARGRQVPGVVTFVFGFAIVVRPVAAFAFAALMSRSVMLAGLASTVGSLASVLVIAAQLALAFPLTRA